MREKAFNLLDEPWLPACFADGGVAELGLLEIFRRSDEIGALAETAPPSLVAEYRLLLAITHRALVSVGTWKDKDRACWFRKGLPVEDICAYLERWRERFWLFHPEAPFMQVAALADCDETKKTYPSSTISLEQFYCGGMFNQEVYNDSAWAPSVVIRSLLGYLQFVPGGFFLGKKLRKGGSEKAGALLNTAAVLPIGENLAQTLCLCLHPAPTGNAVEPDLPAWEKPQLTIDQLRADPLPATGSNDRYTRQSRAVLLLRENESSVCVRRLHFSAGQALGDDPNAPDPMASFRPGKGRAGKDILVRLRFSEGRAFWRDLPALVPNPANTSLPAAVLSHAASLHQEINFDVVYQPVLVAGLTSEKAKLERWRAEQITLPAAFLADVDKAAYLREQVAFAENLFDKIRTLAAKMLAETLPRSKDTKNRAGSTLKNGPFVATYFAQAERLLPKLMKDIGIDPEQAGVLWRENLREAAESAWQQVLTSMGTSIRALRADAKYRPCFNGLLNRKVPKNDVTINEV
ncbi:MAG: type I-E CRISPR-associated protein Cse1/CasA [Desulfovibrio sp.]|jgi:CRISPR system Cascade subunit CasA|nr:type I-E CRISPR-associated protein Cse1/CasA [Desulfovibrio sp.]